MDAAGELLLHLQIEALELKKSAKLSVTRNLAASPLRSMAVLVMIALENAIHSQVIKMVSLPTVDVAPLATRSAIRNQDLFMCYQSLLLFWRQTPIQSLTLTSEARPRTNSSQSSLPAIVQESPHPLPHWQSLTN